MDKHTFEQFLIDRHASQYLGLDDEMPDDYQSWLGTLDAEDFMLFGEKYGAERYKKGIEECVNLAKREFGSMLGDK
jgi:hypothetical protein